MEETAGIEQMCILENSAPQLPLPVLNKSHQTLGPRTQLKKKCGDLAFGLKETQRLCLVTQSNTMDRKECQPGRRMSPRLTNSCHWLRSPSTRLITEHWSQRWHDTSGLLDKATTDETNLSSCYLASPIQPFPESKRKVISKRDLWHTEQILTYCLAPALSIRTIALP